MHNEFAQKERIAYFSMEIAFENGIPTYSGGLGVLAGDTVLSAADLGVPLVAVTLVSRNGYFRQEIDKYGRQMEFPDPWDPSQHASLVNASVVVSIEGRQVWVRAWLYVVRGHGNGGVPLILLDTDTDQNRPDDREITRVLYGDGPEYRLKQEIVLGIGGARMLQALGFRVRRYHLNEGHSAFLALELLDRYRYAAIDVSPEDSPYVMPRVRELCNFTTHTPVAAGHDKFPYALVQRILGDTIDTAVLKKLAGKDELNMTELALNLSEYVNGVAKRHADVSRRYFHGHEVHAVTNGVHARRWAAPSFATLYDAQLPGWHHEPELLVRADRIPDEAIRQAHLDAKQRLIDKVHAVSGVSFDANLSIIGFARRMTGYKRADLLFSNLERLRLIAGRWPLQIVLAGKAHPRDDGGKYLIEALHSHMRELADVIPIAFLPNYDMDTALLMVSGSDLWLNTPLRPLEASGTSGMKAAFNGVPQLSVLDGWWIEGCIEGVTGWAIGDASETANSNDAAELYAKLEQVVLPLFYSSAGRDGWSAVMKGAICKNASFFNSHRMMRRYASEAYVR